METIVKILPNEDKAPVRKLADAELHFRGGELDGMKLVGFAIWQRPDRHGCDVTFPARPFTIEGRHRRYLLFRAIGDPSAQDRVRAMVLQAYAAYEGVAEDAVS